MTATTAHVRATRTNSERWRNLVRTALLAAIALIALRDVAAEARSRRRRAARRVEGWWSRVERRQERDVHRAEFDYVARILKSRS